MTRKDSTERHKQKVLPLKAVKVEWPYNTNCHVEKSKKKKMGVWSTNTDNLFETHKKK